MNSDHWIECDYFPVKQPIGEFYVASISQKELLQISYFDIRRVEAEEKGEIESYLGIQRELSKNRVKEIGEYVTTVDATFPNSIIIAIDGYSRPNDELGYDSFRSVDNIQVDQTRRKLMIRRAPDVAKIIDGQHRIAGLQDLGSASEEFQLIVTIFVDMDIASQALVFATINKAQTKVNKSLVYDLYDYAKSRSPQKTAHNIAVLLDQREDSPFAGRIKRLGRANDEYETITQATFVESLLRYISRNPNRDADDLKRGKSLEQVSGSIGQRLIFRERFRQEKDAEIAKILWDYFDAVRARWPAWDLVERGNILNRSTGFVALMRFLEFVYQSAPSDSVPALRAHFRRTFDSVRISSDRFTPQVYKPGSGGQSALLKDLKVESNLA